MSAAATYQQFLAAPNSSLLAANASLHYITTTSSFSGPTEIIKHLNTLRNQVTKKAETALDVIDGQNALVVIISTTLEFHTTGAVYLPGLDDNFLADRKVYIPITHIVNFDDQGKISQIRQTWDQGSLLKQVDVIGKSGRNWPIRDSQEQIKLITNCLKASGKIAASAPDANEIIIRSRGNTQNAMRDPHATLSLFAPREQQEDAVAQAAVSPYAGSRPHQRSITDILNDEPLDEPSSPSSGRARDQSPNKAKIGAGKNFAPSRLFDADPNAPLEPESPDETRSTDKFYRPHPSKFQHFDFADGSDPSDAAVADAASAAMTAKVGNRPHSSKANSNWSFEDFTTPQKPKASKAFRHQDVRHWDTDRNTIQETPVHHNQKAHPQAETHFEFIDDGERTVDPRQAHPRGAGTNEGSHLYENNLYNEDGSAPTPGPARALGNITNLSDRRKDFDAHFAMDDKSPRLSGQGQNPGITDNQKKVVNMMNANWSSYDKSPVVQKENKPQKQQTEESGINIAGDGMGGRKGTNRDWMFGEDDDTPKPATKKPVAGQKSFWDF
ncbi:hypothetical protein F5X68DRAFT_76566 [Plectosphaerella plurivora]|uniref:Uncharacterized protein n=1 Tax=Plectosphaerella plurivora TaxID=936078 RepID=A0A9P9ABH9_9PEZI|nr:hypothetical protein F5X68DRAFT_76566 [Plectosphaerella plurivora]